MELLGLSHIWIICLIAFLAMWEGVWKLIALWKAARNNDLGWFLCIGIINTAGILPIVYILTQKKRD
jgi:uncharacterized membrane protein HdeD (DUF308 family)